MDLLGVRLPVLMGLLLIALPMVVVGVRGWRGALRRDGRVGVRTPTALTDADTFTLANRAAGPAVLVAGVVAGIGGLAALALPSIAGIVLAALIGLVGAVLIARGGVIIGDRAAKVMLASKPTVPSGCAGCSCGGCAVVGKS